MRIIHDHHYHHDDQIDKFNDLNNCINKGNPDEHCAALMINMKMIRARGKKRRWKRYITPGQR